MGRPGDGASAPWAVAARTSEACCNRYRGEVETRPSRPIQCRCTEVTDLGELPSSMDRASSSEDPCFDGEYTCPPLQGVPVRQPHDDVEQEHDEAEQEHEQHDDVLVLQLEEPAKSSLGPKSTTSKVSDSSTAS